MRYGSPTGPQLFVHCVTSHDIYTSLSEMVPGLHRYPERALLMAGPDDIVCVPGEVDSEYLGFLAQLGLGPRAEHVVAVAVGRAEDHSRPLWKGLLEDPEALRTVSALVQRRAAIRLNPFIVSPGQFELAAALEAITGTTVRVLGADPRLVNYADQKHNVRTKVVELGVPVAEGETVELTGASGQRWDLEPLRRTVVRYLGRSGRVIVQGTCGASGSSAFIVGTHTGVEALLEQVAQRTDNWIYLVEVMVDATVSPNVQIYIAPEDGTVSCIGVTDQQWERPLVYGGNLFPSISQTAGEMVGWARTLATWLRGEGYIGLVGFDFVEYTDPRSGRPKMLLAEVNPRVNGATYPLAVMERLNSVQQSLGQVTIAAFRSGTVETPARSFAELRDALGHLFYRAETGTGVIPYNVGCLEYGKCGVIVLGPSREAVAQMYAEIKVLMEDR